MRDVKAGMIDINASLATSGEKAGDRRYTGDLQIDIKREGRRKSGMDLREL